MQPCTKLDTYVLLCVNILIFILSMYIGPLEFQGSTVKVNRISDGERHTVTLILPVSHVVIYMQSVDPPSM